MHRLIDWTEIAADGAAHYSDEYLEHFGERYLSSGMQLRGVSFEGYLARPKRYDSHASGEPLPLLPRQQRVQRRLIDLERVADLSSFTGERNGSLGL